MEKRIKLSTWSQLIFILKTHNIDIKDYDYVEDKTTDKYKSDHPLVMYGRRFYENPYLWTRMLDEKIYDAIDFILDVEEFVIDLTVVRACLQTQNRETDYPAVVIKRHLEDMTKLDKSEAEDELDVIIDCISEVDKLDLLKEILNYSIEELKLEPKYNQWGDATNGSALYNACDHDTTDLAEYLVSLGIDASRNDSMAFAKACKKGHYRLALMLLDRGADLHTKNDLAMKMIERNDRKGTVPRNEENYRKALIDRFIKEEI